MPTTQPTSRIVKVISCAIMLLLGACCPEMPAIPDATQGFQKGLNYTAWAREQLSTPESDHSLKNLAATGANWVAIVVFGYQQTYTSTAITRDPARTPSDQEITHAIATAHDLGLKVMLKPHVDLRHDRDHWRGNIGEAFTSEAQWQAWFESYAEYINHYAKLAQEHDVEQFCIGTELVGTSHRETEWREIVAGVREHYSGPITYAGNHGTEDVGITWWDAVDFIGIDAYYVLTDKTDPTLDELKAAWVGKGYVDTMAGLAEKYDKPILITEIGYRSADGTIKTPWDWSDLPLDLQEQADAYRAALDVLWGQPWLEGIYWWNWDVNPQRGGLEDTGYSPSGKPAADVLRTYYGGRQETVIKPTPYPASAISHVAAPSMLDRPGWTSYTVADHVNDLAFDRDGNLWLATPVRLVKWDMANDTRTRYTTADGLADTWVEAITVAPNGELWLATGRGISRFDGKGWTTYNKDNGLPCNGVTDIAFAPNGDVWVGTFGCGAARFDGTAWTVYTEEDGLLERHVLSVAATPDGTIWFGTWKGVSRFDSSALKETEVWTSHTDVDRFSLRGVETITVESNGALWFGTWHGIARLNGGLWTSYPSECVQTWVESIVIAPDGTPWAATREGIARFDQTTWTWVPYFSIEGQPEERGASIAFAPDGSMWVGTYNSGIYRFDADGGTRHTFDNNPPSNKVSAIATAPDGTIWFGARPDRSKTGGGVFSFDGETWTAYTQHNGLASDYVTAIAIDPRGTLWAGTGESGVSRFDGRTWQTYTTKDGLASNWITAIATASDGTVWISSQDGGLSSFDGAHWQTHPTPGITITSVLVTSDNSVWVGTETNGLARFDGHTWTTHETARVISIAEATDSAALGDVWIGTPYCRDHDTVCMVHAGGAPKHIARFDGSTMTEYSPKDGLPESKIKSIAVAHDGTVWVGTGNGIAHFDGERWVTLTTQDGLVDNNVKAITVGAEGDIWIGTSNGISRYTP